MTQNPSEEEYLTPQQVMAILKISLSTFDRYVAQGKFSLVQYGGPHTARRVARSELDQFLLRQQQGEKNNVDKEI